MDGERDNNNNSGEQYRKQRALIFQGGGALGAYEAGVYRVLHDWVYKNLEVNEKNENLFDVIAGTSIGAINGAIILSQVLKNKQADPNGSKKLYRYWGDSANVLEEFWTDRIAGGRNILRDWYDWSFWPWNLFHNTAETMMEAWNNMLDRTEESVPSQWLASTNPFFKEWFGLLHFVTEAWDISASADAARKHWTTRTFGSPNVAAAIPRLDFKLWDNPYGFRFRGEQRRVPFYWGYPNYSLKESCNGYVSDSIQTSFEEKEPRLLLVTVDVKSGDTISFDSYSRGKAYNEYDEYRQDDISDEVECYDVSNRENLRRIYDHYIEYDNGIQWEQLSTTFSMPELYRYASLEDKSSKQRKGKEEDGKKKNNNKIEKERTYWDGGMSSNTPLRELIDLHKRYWKTKIGDAKLWDGGDNPVKKIKIPSLDVYIADVWPAQISDYPVPSDNDFVISRKTDLLLMDKTEYEESVTKMITDYINLASDLIQALEDQKADSKVKDILDKRFAKSTIHTNRNRKTYREFLLKGRFEIDRLMRIERKDDSYAIGLAMEDFSSHSINQLLALGKYDALDKVIHTLAYAVQNLDGRGVTKDTKDALLAHLKNARKFLGKSPENFDYRIVMEEHLYKFIVEVKDREKLGELGPQARLLRAYGDMPKEATATSAIA
jgi:predicted acylesterase/phospholipase RssA